MRHGDGRDEDRERLRRLRDREDYGQADYSNRYAYDPDTRSGYRTFDDGRDGYRAAEPRRWDERDERIPEEPRPRRAGPSDRVLWAIITERLDHERRLDLRDVEVIVRDREVTLNGTVRHKGDKRRIEDVADCDGVRNVQNNLRVRERSHWTLF